MPKALETALLAYFFLSLKKTYILKKSMRLLLHFLKIFIRMNHRYSKYHSFILNKKVYMSIR